MPVNLSQTLQQSMSSAKSGIKHIRVLLVIASMLLLSACGNKGELYLPEKESSTESVEIETSETENLKGDDSEDIE